MKKLESTKRIIVLLFGLIELLLQTSVYAWFWYHVYYPLLSLPRISAEGYALGNGLKLYFRGHLLVIAIYFVLLLFFSNTYGGFKIGYLKPMDVFFSQIFSLLMVNIIFGTLFKFLETTILFLFLSSYNFYYLIK